MKVLIFMLPFIMLLSCTEQKIESGTSDVDYIIKYYSDSLVEEVVQKQNGFLNGKAFKFDEYGNKLWEFQYVNDQQEGLQYYYSQGKLNFIVPYKNGKQHGWARRYGGPCGSINEEGQYENGAMNGLWYQYYGKELLEIGLFRNDSLVKIVYRNKKYSDRGMPLPPLVIDCDEQWMIGCTLP